MNEIATPERFEVDRLYEGIPQDFDHRHARPFTVTVAGLERLDGEAPHAYVVDAHSTAEAWAAALAWHMVQVESGPDAYVVAGESFEGEPPAHCGYHWNDLRDER